jgi:SAM-dependent methyltransferase
MWDQRYDCDEYVYGIAPNDFLVSMAGRLSGEKLLCLGEGEGRNAVWLAEQGFRVTAVDASAVGLDKARRLARDRGVKIDTVRADLADFPVGSAAWDGVISIFCHLPPDLRADLHRRVVGGLKPGGRFLLEAYTPAQLLLGTGGPPVAELMMRASDLVQELAGLRFLHLEEREREIHEGNLHRGTGAVVQLLAERP